MKRHSTDLFALLAGLAFAIAGTTVIISQATDSSVSGRGAAAAGLILLGAVVFGHQQQQAAIGMIHELVEAGGYAGARDRGAITSEGSGASVELAGQSVELNFALASGAVVTPYTDLAAQYAVADRYFQSIAGQSISNDMYLAVAKEVFIDNAFEPEAWWPSASARSLK